ncbi:hypothetical protein V8G54_019446 [Vigna mungo]|uniref:CCT domain-containing protein n=1 Tax=Vigna mungo TaxID=3915 RepID=A0AAQ3NBU6_VIGMU
MCSKNTPSSPNIQTTSIMKRTRKPTKRYHSSSSSSSSSSSLKPHRRGNRTKTRRPKFVSLRLQLSEPENMGSQPKPKPKALQQPQLNLFPLHPEHHDMHEEQNVALLFSAEGGATLTGLLEEDSMSPSSATTEGSLSALTCPEEDAGNWLVRKAMRRRESEEGSEERWVCYSEVVEEKKETMEEVTSYCMMGAATTTTATTTSFGLLSLKLDHQGILNAWSDKGSLYVAGEGGPHIVPDFLNGFLLHNAFLPHVAWDGWGNGVVGNTWNVTEDCGGNKTNVKEENGWKLGQREASVQRYKEKRQSRLFSKKIRYEVRKLNAEKRPRMKVLFPTLIFILS